MITWKERLADRMPEDLAREIDVYETQLELKRQGKIDEKLFAETRLRRGAYGQRYDNGQRHDGVASSGPGISRRRELTKGPETLWDAPGMQRIKIPFGGRQRRADGRRSPTSPRSTPTASATSPPGRTSSSTTFTSTTRRSLMRRLAAVGITTREACGNSVRNVTACPIAGVCRDESFDVTPYAKAMMRFLLGHPDTQDFGRKFKVAFSGCKQNACGLVSLHDLGLIARRRGVDGAEKRGFEVCGRRRARHRSVPGQAVRRVRSRGGDSARWRRRSARVFARLGEKRNRDRARLKFLVAKLGIDEFRRLVLEERAQLPSDARWTSYLRGPARLPRGAAQGRRLL